MGWNYEVWRFIVHWTWPTRVRRRRDCEGRCPECHSNVGRVGGVKRWRRLTKGGCVMKDAVLKGFE